MIRRLKALFSYGCVAAALGLTLATPPPASASAAPGLCKPDLQRVDIPDTFAADACFDGARLVLRSTLDLALEVQRRGDAQPPLRIHSDLGLAALATRTLNHDQGLFLPGDTDVIPVGHGMAAVALAESRSAGEYALASTAARFIPGKPADVYTSFTGLIKELDDDFSHYSNCLARNNWIGQLGCRAIVVRDVYFALGRVALKLSVKEVASVILSAATFAQWANKQPAEVRKLLASRPITIRPGGIGTSLSAASTCSDWYDASLSERQAFAATVRPTVNLSGSIPHEPEQAAAFMYGFIYGECDRARRSGHPPETVSISRVLAAEFPGPGA